MRLSVCGRPQINRHGQPPKLGRVVRAHNLFHLLERDINIVGAVLALGRGSEDRLGQARSVLKSDRQRDPAHRSLRLVFLPAGSGQISACHAFHREHGGAIHQHRAPLKWLTKRTQRRRKLRCVGGDQVVGDHVLQKLKPEQRNLGENLAFARDSAAQHVIEGGNPVACHQQQRAVHVIKVAHFATPQQRCRSQVGFEECGQRRAFQESKLKLDSRAADLLCQRAWRDCVERTQPLIHIRFGNKPSCVTTVTDPRLQLRDTPIVNMVRETSKQGFSRAGRHEAAVERGSRS